MRATLRFALLLFLALVPSLRAQSDINGKWRWRAAGGAQEILFEFKVVGPKLTGMITMIQARLHKSGDDGYFLDAETPFDELRAIFFPPVAFPIADGQITGNTISFTQDSFGATTGAFPGQTLRQPKPEKLLYTGQIEGDRIQFKRTYQATPGNVWIIGTHSVSFIAERVK